MTVQLTRPVATNSTRFMSPAGAQAAAAKISQAKADVATCRKALTDHQNMMMRALFRPEGYKVAVAKLETLKANLAKAEKTLQGLLDLQKRA